MNHLQNKQLEKRFESLRSLRYIPKKGWIRTLRDLYHMSASQLAQRAGVSRVSISQFEKGEKAQTITLKSLFKVAEALNCDVQYTLVPKTPVEDFCKQEAQYKAKEIVKQIQKTMQLEDQALTADETKDLYHGILKDFEKHPNKIWGESL
jgi:predicted DNA-binding mobile mystery protein A